MRNKLALLSVILPLALASAAFANESAVPPPQAAPATDSTPNEILLRFQFGKSLQDLALTQQTLYDLKLQLAKQKSDWEKYSQGLWNALPATQTKIPAPTPDKK
jgi:hypothetical protein